MSMKIMLKALVAHLQDREVFIVKDYTFQSVDNDPTYGEQVRSTSVQFIDFEALLREIDDFADEFKEN